MNVWEYEKTVYEREDVRIVIRAPWKTEIGDYAYERAAAGNSSVSAWLAARIYNALDGHEVVVLDGTGSVPHGLTKMSTLRQSYAS